MVNIRSLTVEYQSKTAEEKVTALQDINLHLEAGDIYAVIGPSGSGKSTLLLVLAGILKQYEGEVLIDGSPVNPKTQRIGLVLQNYGLLPWKTVYQNAVLGTVIKDGKKKAVHADKQLGRSKDWANSILDNLGLGELKSRFPNSLSGGQKQRVEIARSFILKPQLLLMDEPFSALDAITREEIQDLFLDIWKENRVSTLFVTHSIEEAIYIGKKIVILTPSPGKIARIIENPLFGMRDLRLHREYYELGLELRKIVKEEWVRQDA